MANSLGTLTLDLVARIGGFTGPLDKGEQSMKKFAASAAKAGGIAGAALATGVTVATAALAAMVTKQLEVIGDQDDLAKRLRTTVESIGTLTRAGELSGIALDQLTNGAQKLDLALGKAAAGGKTQVEAFERLGLSYQKVAALPIDERILSINQALEKNVPAYERAAVAATLFGAKNGAAFQALDAETLAEANRQITVFGVKLSGIDSSKVEAAGDAISIFGLAADGVAKQLTVELSPLLTQLSKDFLDSAEEAGGLGTAVQKTVRTTLEGIGFIIDAGDGVGRVFKIISAEFDGLVASASGSIIAGVYQTLSLLNKLPGVDLSEQLGDLEGNYNAQVAAALDATERMRAALETPLAGTAFLEYYDNAQKAAEGAADSSEKFGQTTGEAFAKNKKAGEDAAKAAAAAAKQIAAAFKSSEQDYERQIALINTSTDAQKNATEVTKLLFEIQSGKLVGINALQQERLEGLANELDALNAIKQANEESAKANAFGATLDARNSTVRGGFDQDLAGAGSGDKLKERLKQDLQIQQDYNDQVAELQQQLNGGDITQSLYDRETELLGEALAERMIMQQDFYNQLDAAQANWLDGVNSAYENYRDTATDYTTQAADATKTLLDGTTDSIAANTEKAILGTQSFGDAAKQTAATFASTVLSMIIKFAAMQAIQAGLNAFTSTAAIPLIGPLAAPAAAASALAFAGGLSAQVAGMAHDGLDKVPQDGTWFLQKGERVTTSETSAKLDRTLDNIKGNPANGKAGGQTVNIIEDASKAGTQERRTGENGEEMIDVFIADLYGDGRVKDAISRKFGIPAQGQ